MALLMHFVNKLNPVINCRWILEYQGRMQHPFEIDVDERYYTNPNYEEEFGDPRIPIVIEYGLYSHIGEDGSSCICYILVQMVQDIMEITFLMFIFLMNIIV